MIMMMIDDDDDDQNADDKDEFGNSRATQHDQTQHKMTFIYVYTNKNNQS